MRPISAPADRASDRDAATPETDLALDVTGLIKQYDGHRAVDGLDLRLPVGQVLALLGPNGAGKTTTVEICEGFARPDDGSVRGGGARK